MRQHNARLVDCDGLSIHLNRAIAIDLLVGRHIGKIHGGQGPRDEEGSSRGRAGAGRIGSAAYRPAGTGGDSTGRSTPRPETERTQTERRDEEQGPAQLQGFTKASHTGKTMNEGSPGGGIEGA